MDKCYTGNNVIVLDDEMSWEKNKVFDSETFKNFITNKKDVFSRKNKGQQIRSRSFIIIRTSNYLRNVYQVEQRRSIIFNCNLKMLECRIKKAPKDTYQQMLAEAYEDFKQNGLYQLTEEDKLSLIEQNKDNINLDDEKYTVLLAFIEDLIERSDYRSKVVDSRGYTADWRGYSQYCKDLKIKTMYSGHFWESLYTLSKLSSRNILVKDEENVAGFWSRSSGTKLRYFIIQTQKVEEPDIEGLVF